MTRGDRYSSVEHMNVCVVGGAGYVGLITGLCLSHIGHQVVNVDIDRRRIQRLQAGDYPIYEDNINPLLERNLRTGRIRFSTELQGTVESSDIVFIAVGTPSKEDGEPDTSQITRVAEDLAGRLDSYKVLVVKSTVPVSTLETLRDILSRENEEGKDFDIVANPEFLREGKGISDFLYPDRIVIGSNSENASRVLREVYEPIIHGRVPGLSDATKIVHVETVPVIETSPASAQIIKYASNAFLATRISFINEIASICDHVGADISEVVRGVGYDPRIGHAYLAPGIGFGGPCLEKDLRALIGISETNGHHPDLLLSVLNKNDNQIEEAFTKFQSLVEGPLNGKIVAVFGLTFKAGTDDVRNSPALKVIAKLNEHEASVRVYDPVANPEVTCLGPLVSWCDDPYEAVDQAHALIISTDWPHFNDLDYSRIKKSMASACILDGRNLLDPQEVRQLNFRYAGIGLS